MAAPAASMGSASAASGGKYAAALAVLATVFFMWGFATVLNDILVPHLKAVFQLNYGQSLLIQFVFYLGYLLMSLPAAKLLERIGYKRSIIIGLIGMAGSALLFAPAAGFALVLTVIAVTTSGALALWCLIAVGLCHSVMFPTIFTLGIKGLGPLTEEGSGLLIMAIAGGALAALQGVIADRVGLQLSYLLPAACYVYVLFYALWGSRTSETLGEEKLTL